jgi:hypothetical protein
MKEETANPKPLWALARKEPGCRRYDSLIARFLFSCFIRIRRLLDIPGFKEIALAISIISYSRSYSADLS